MGLLAGLLALGFASVLAPPYGLAAEAELSSPAPAVVLSEVFYHPPERRRALSAEAEEWIELHNFSPDPVDLGGWRLSGGIEFAFPAGARLQPGACVLVAADPGLFAELHAKSNATILGPYAGHLSNKGESIELRDANANLVDGITYSDRSPWPVSADGLGRSLVRRSAKSPGDSARAWRASARIGGTPGGHHKPPPP